MDLMCNHERRMELSRWKKLSKSSIPCQDHDIIIAQEVEDARECLSYLILSGLAPLSYYLVANKGIRLSLHGSNIEIYFLEIVLESENFCMTMTFYAYV